MTASCALLASHVTALYMPKIPPCKNGGICLYSDLGFLIERDGVRYSEAVDPATANRQYIETEILERKDDEQNGN